MKLYTHPRCTTCKKAVDFLKQNKISYQTIDLTQKAPSKKELKIMLNHYDGEIRKLFNTSGMQYRALNLKEKLPQLSTEEAIDLLASDGMLVKRPFLIDENDLGLVGFREDSWINFCK